MHCQVCFYDICIDCYDRKMSDEFVLQNLSDLRDYNKINNNDILTYLYRKYNKTLT